MTTSSSPVLDRAWQSIFDHFFHRSASPEDEFFPILKPLDRPPELPERNLEIFSYLKNTPLKKIDGGYLAQLSSPRLANILGEKQPDDLVKLLLQHLPLRTLIDAAKKLKDDKTLLCRYLQLVPPKFLYKIFCVLPSETIISWIQSPTEREQALFLIQLLTEGLSGHVLNMRSHEGRRDSHEDLSDVFEALANLLPGNQQEIFGKVVKSLKFSKTLILKLCSETLRSKKINNNDLKGWLNDVFKIIQCSEIVVDVSLINNQKVRSVLLNLFDLIKERENFIKEAHTWLGPNQNLVLQSLQFWQQRVNEEVPPPVALLSLILTLGFLQFSKNKVVQLSLVATIRDLTDVPFPMVLSNEISLVSRRALRDFGLGFIIGSLSLSSHTSTEIAAAFVFTGTLARVIKVASLFTVEYFRFSPSGTQSLSAVVESTNQIFLLNQLYQKKVIAGLAYSVFLMLTLGVLAYEI